MRAVRNFLVLLSGFARWKVTINENVSFVDHASGIRLPDVCKIGHKSEKRHWCHNLPTWPDRQIFFHVSLVKFSFWSKFLVNIMTGSGVMRIFVYKELTRNPEIRNTPVWISSNIWRLRSVRVTKFDTNVSNKKLLNVAKRQVYSIYRFWVIKEKPTGRGKITLHYKQVKVFSWLNSTSHFAILILYSHSWLKRICESDMEL